MVFGEFLFKLLGFLAKGYGFEEMFFVEDVGVIGYFECFSNLSFTKAWEFP